METMVKRTSVRIRNCPLCKSKKSELLHIQKFAAQIEHRVVTCTNCGFVYVNNSPAQTYYNKYYRDTSHYEIDRDYDYHRKYARIINKFFPKSARILDIGCSTGHLLYLLNKLGYKHVTGLDPSPICKKIAKEKFNIDIFASDLYGFEPKHKLDGVILAAVLEHLDKVNEAIAKASDILAGEGLLFLAVPDAGRFYRQFDEPFGEFSTEHINFFSESYLYRFLPQFTRLYITSDDKAIYSVWRKGSDVRDSVAYYIDKSDAKMRRIKTIINNLPDKVLVWGAGSLTQRLLETTNLGSKVVKFIDKSDKLIGSKIQGKEIIGPSEINNYNYPVLISSFRFKEEIIKQIVILKYKNKIITFS